MKPTLANELQAYRRRLRLSQADAAARLGVPVRTLQNWEQGTRTPRGLALEALRAKLKLSGTVIRKAHGFHWLS